MESTNLLTAELLKIVQATGNFAIEQAPGFAKEFLQWEFYGHLFWGFALFSLSGLLLNFIKKYIKTHKEDHDFTESEFSIFLVGLLSAILFVVSLDQFNSAAKVKFAPKVYLVENIAKIIK